MSKRPYFGPSEAQVNADALANRGRTYADPNAASFRIQWDWNRREPKNLREAVHMVRKAYQDEVPTAIHEGPDSIGEGGTPKYRETFLRYMDSPTATDAGRAVCATSCRFHPDNVFGALSDGGRNHESHCPAHPSNRPLVAYHLTPFRATLSDMERGPSGTAKRAEIVRRITIGSQGPKEAAIAAGVPDWCAGLVAEDSLRAFLRRHSDLRLSLPKEDAAA